MQVVASREPLLLLHQQQQCSSYNPPATAPTHTESRDDEKVQRGVKQPCSEEINLITDIERRMCFSRIADLRRRDLDQLL